MSSSDALVFFGATGNLTGDATLFAREDAVEAEWRIVGPILTSLIPLHGYEAGTWGRAEADRLTDGSSGWHKPQLGPRSPS